MIIPWMKPDFGMGEISPSALGRIDVARYHRACFALRNVKLLKLGAAIRRSGTRFVAEVKDSSKFTRKVPFQYSTQQTYSLEFGDEYIRFFRNQAALVSSGNITDATNATPIVITSANHGLVSGQTMTITDVEGNTAANGTWIITVINANTFSLDDSVGNEVYTAGGSYEAIAEIASPYATDDLAQLTFNQSNDVLTICHPDYQPRSLSRNPGSDALPGTWSLTSIAKQNGPYQSLNSTSTTLTPSATSGNIQITASTALFAATDAPNSVNTGRLIRIAHTVTVGSTTVLQWGEARVTNVVSSTVVDATTTDDFATTNASDVWHLGAWSNTTGWPSCSVYHKDRQWFGGTNAEPDRLDGSMSNNYTNFLPSRMANDEVLATHALMFKLQDNKVNAIKCLLSTSRGLLALTNNGPFTLVSSDPSEPISAKNFSIRRRGTVGIMAPVQAVQSDGRVIFPDATGQKVVQLEFNADFDEYRPTDLTTFANHITRPEITDFAIQTEAVETLWAVRSDGVLIGGTHSLELQAIGWHRHVLGGSNAEVESVCVIREGDADELWLIVKRTINGQTKRYVEFLEQDFGIGDDLEDYFGVDSGLSYDGSPETTFSGLDHLEGETVDVFADGVSVGPKTVTGGSVTLASAASVVHVGLGFDSTLTPTPIVPETQWNDAWGSLKRVVSISAMLHNTVGGYVASGDISDPLPVSEEDDPDELFEGLRYTPLSSIHERRASVSFTQSEPLPMTILSLSGYMDVGG